MLVHFIVMIVRKTKCLLLKNLFEEKEMQLENVFEKENGNSFPPPSLGLSAQLHSTPSLSPLPGPRPSWLPPFLSLSHPLTGHARLSASSSSNRPLPPSLPVLETVSPPALTISHSSPPAPRLQVESVCAPEHSPSPFPSSPRLRSCLLRATTIAGAPPRPSARNPSDRAVFARFALW